MRMMIVVGVLGLVACGGELSTPPAYVCSDPCPGATTVAAMPDGRMWCYLEYGAGGHHCGMVFERPTNETECAATTAFWMEWWPLLCA